MRIPQSYIQKCKVVAHIFQAIFVFVAFCLTITVMTKDGDIGGPTKYFFAMCFVSIPAIIYLTMVPMWSRAQRFASAYAFLAVDALYTILWFAAFIAVAMWNSSGIKKGGEDKKIGADDRNCTTFAYGDEAKCNVSKAAVGVGVMVFLFFAMTTGVSGYYLHKFLREGVMPYQSSKTNPHHATGDTSYNAPNKDNTWSTEIETANHRDSIDSISHQVSNQQEDEYALLHSTETDEGRHPGRPLSWGEDRVGGGGYGEGGMGRGYADYQQGNNSRGIAAGVDGLSPGGYEEYRREAATTPLGFAGHSLDRQPTHTSHTSGKSHGGSGYNFG